MIYVQNEKSPQVVLAQPFIDEAELERVIRECPSLVLGPDESPIRYVDHQIALGTGIADILLLDRDMLPTIVEVKLARNGESRREVVGQVFDYVSSLADLTFDELDSRVSNRLEQAVRNLSDNPEDEHAFEKARVRCGTNLRAGTVRVVIVVDEAIDGLARIMRYMADHSSIGVRLLAVEKRVAADGGSIFVPRVVVEAEGVQAVSPSRPSMMTDNFAGVIKAYDQMASTGLKTFGNNPTYRIIRPKNWPARLHYEFVFSKLRGTISAELHVESDELKTISEQLPEIAAKTQPMLLPLQIGFDPRWSSNRGRLQVIFSEDTAAEDVAKGMIILINSTLEPITTMLKS